MIQNIHCLRSGYSGVVFTTYLGLGGKREQ